MNNTLKFSIAEMTSIHASAVTYQSAYSDAIESLKTEISVLSNNWKSDETGTYEAFKQKFDEKIGTLELARDMMKEFCDRIESKKNEFEDAATTAKGLFL